MAVNNHSLKICIKFTQRVSSFNELHVVGSGKILILNDTIED